MKRPWMPLYIADYLKKTTHLGAIESGAYLHLIMDYWQNGTLPTDDRQLARIAKMTDREWKTAKPVLAAFFAPEWKHERINEELEKIQRVSRVRRTSVMARYNKQSTNYPTNVDTNDPTKLCTNTPTKPDTLHTRKKDAANAAPIDPDADLFRRGKEVLGNEAGSLIAKLKKAKNGSIPLTRAAIEQASIKQNPREYIGAVLRGATEKQDDFYSPTAGII